MKRLRVRHSRLLPLLAALLACSAFAVELTWTPPTQNTDGTPLTDLAKFKVYYGNTAGGPYTTNVLVNDSTATSLQLPLPNGTYYFVATAINAQGVESAYSNEASKVVVAQPRPPSNLTVQSLIAYAIVKQENKLVMLPVGTIPAGTECDQTQTANGKFAVPVDSVTWAGSVEELVVFADCA